MDENAVFITKDVCGTWIEMIRDIKNNTIRVTAVTEESVQNTMDNLWVLGIRPENYLRKRRK